MFHGNLIRFMLANKIMKRCGQDESKLPFKITNVSASISETVIRVKANLITMRR